MKLQVDNAEQNNLHFLRTLTHKAKCLNLFQETFKQKKETKHS